MIFPVASVSAGISEKEEKEVSLRWKSGFGDSTQKMKERMENLMRKKKWNRVAAVALVAALTFANSIPHLPK